MKRRTLSLVFAGASVLAVACIVAGEMVSHHSRPVLFSPGSNTGPAWEVRLADGRAYLWRRPPVQYRPDWAGQVTRFGFRYTRWSNGAWDFGVPLRGAAAVFGIIGITCGAALWWRRARGSRGFPVSAAAPGL